MLGSGLRVGACRLGSRLYYEFVATALGDDVAWERLADSVAVEVRRHGAPAPSSATPAGAGTAAAQDIDSVGEAAAPPAKTVAGAELTVAPMREVAAPSVGVSSIVNTTRSTVNNNSNMYNNNSCDTTLILM